MALVLLRDLSLTEFVNSVLNCDMMGCYDEFTLGSGSFVGEQRGDE